jgi:hypothetical protein
MVKPPMGKMVLVGVVITSTCTSGKPFGRNLPMTTCKNPTSACYESHWGRGSKVWQRWTTDGGCPSPTSRSIIGASRGLSRALAATNAMENTPPPTPKDQPAATLTTLMPPDLA